MAPWRAALLVLLLVAPHAVTVSAKHNELANQQAYVADSLFTTRWATGALQEQWFGRAPWKEPLTGQAVRVGIIDTGIDPEHPDLRDTIVAWRDFLANRPEPYDDDTHGTHVAGIIAAGGHFQLNPLGHYFPLGARGLAPGVQLLVAKAMDGEGDGDPRHVAAAIYWLLDPNGDGDLSDGAEIINLSIGVELPEEDAGSGLGSPVTVPSFGVSTPEDIRIIEEAVRAATDAGAIIVVAAGNHEPGHTGTVTFPGTMSEVITVGAVDGDGRLAAFSNQGAPGSTKPDLVAPGVILSTFPHARDTMDGIQDGYLALGGTSMAAPVVSGTIALILESDPTMRGLDPSGSNADRTERIRRVLIETAVSPTGGFDPGYGHGRLQVNAALEAADGGAGDLAWARLLTLLAVAALITGAVYLRRRRADQRQRLALLRAELAARQRHQGDASGRFAPGATSSQTDPAMFAAGDAAADPAADLLGSWGAMEHGTRHLGTAQGAAHDDATADDPPAWVAEAFADELGPDEPPVRPAGVAWDDDPWERVRAAADAGDDRYAWMDEPAPELALEDTAPTGAQPEGTLKKAAKRLRKRLRGVGDEDDGPK